MVILKIKQCCLMKVEKEKHGGWVPPGPEVKGWGMWMACPGAWERGPPFAANRQLRNRSCRSPRTPPPPPCCIRGDIMLAEDSCSQDLSNILKIEINKYLPLYSRPKRRSLGNPALIVSIIIIIVKIIY